jgi:hypothetical protein
MDITLYHGTDARILSMSKEERLQYKKECDLIIDTLYPFFQPLLKWEKTEIKVDGKTIFGYEYPLKLKYGKILNEKGGMYMYQNLFEKLAMIDCRNNNAGLYQYENLYLCSSKLTAASYATSSFAGGEMGLIAYRLIQGADIINFENFRPNSNILSIMNKIREFAKEGNEKPAIVTIENIDVDYLSFEDGKPIEKDNFAEWLEPRRKRQLKFRYTKPLELSECKVELYNKELYLKIKEEEK